MSVHASDATRTWVAVSAVGSGGDLLVSDPLAAPGVPVTYLLPDGRRVEMTRPVPGGGEDWWRGMVSRLDGRTVPGLSWDADGDGRDWKSGVARFSASVARWPLEDPPIEGGGTFVLWEPGREREVWDLLTTPGPLIIMTAAPTVAVPARVVTIDSVGRKRISGDGVLEWSVRWTEVPLTSPMVTSPDSATGAPVVTWGEWEGLDHAWRDRSYLDVCRMVAGMPS
ncbi:hypothetical protein [Actinomyces faecalis]|uniref:hypothetical protein n=1 Tax=Actinomyces faecalis TaxID=2722820 RepID=UPI001553C472|nr:hypothetical protein [Actinomyces faecalis]